MRELALAQQIPERYLIQILLQLKAAGLVHSSRGSIGGYQLSRPASQITVGEVIAAIDGRGEHRHQVGTRSDSERGSGADAEVLETGPARRARSGRSWTRRRLPSWSADGSGDRRETGWTSRADDIGRHIDRDNAPDNRERKSLRCCLFQRAGYRSLPGGEEPCEDVGAF